MQLLLSGSVRRSGKSVRVSAQLINGADGFNVWTRTYDREMEDLFGVQQELARSLTGVFAKVGFLPPPARYTPEPRAYQFYLAGLNHRIKWTRDEQAAAVQRFEAAIQADPNYAAAYAALADVYVTMGFLGYVPPEEGRKKANAAAAKALALGPDLPHALSAMGGVKALYEWDWPAAAKAFRRAHELDPGDAGLHESFILYYLIPSRHLDEALYEVRQAESLDPTSPQMALVHGLVLYCQRDYDDAVEQFKKSIALDPTFPMAHLGLALSHERMAKHREAVAVAEAPYLGAARAMLTRSYAAVGRSAAAAGLIEDLKARREYTPSFHLAVAHLGLGDRARALESLDRALADRSPLLPYALASPDLDGLRSHPRFQQIARQVHPQ